MNKKEFSSLIVNGYVPYWNYDQKTIKRFKRANYINLSSNDIRMLVVQNRDYYKLVGHEDEVAVLFKFDNSYHIVPSDIIDLLLNYESKDKFDNEDYSYYIQEVRKEFNSKPLCLPRVIKDFSDDVLLDIDDNLVSFALDYYLQDGNVTDKENFSLLKLETFINETLENRNIDYKKKKYSKDSIEILFYYWKACCQDKSKWFNDKIEIYKYFIEKYDDVGFQDIYWTLGYNYYEGINGYPCDFVKAEKYLKKYYEITQDPYVARTLGYIYYYGRTTNGIPEKEKAFQYFAIGHFAGHSTEATYKLADCYVKGYGTPKNYEAALNLVGNLFNDEFRNFLDGKPNKLPDVALRLGSYYKNGISINKDLNVAYEYFLLARTSIKIRIDKDEYIGDRSVSYGITNSINEIESELNLSNRIREIDYKYNGYIIPVNNIEHHGYCIKLKKMGQYIYKVEVCGHHQKRKNLKDAYMSDMSIGYSEASDIIEYILYLDENLNCDIDLNHVLETEYNDIEGKEIEQGYLKFTNNKTGESVFLKINSLVFIPHEIKELEKNYLLVNVHFANNNKQYEYLCLRNNVKIGDILKLKNDSQKEVIVDSFKYVYEDQLSLPLNKIGKVI